MKRIYKILFSISFVFIILISILLLTFYSSAFQSFITKKISNFYSEKLNSKIEISNVDINFYNSFSLKNVFISDLNNDTIFFSEEIKIKIDSVNIKESKIFAKEIYFKNTNVKYIVDKKGVSNLKFLILYFSGKNSKSSNSDPIIFAKKLTIENAKFTYKNCKKLNEELKNTCKIDYNFIELENINLKFSNIVFDKNISLDIEKINATEKKGFKIDNISAKIIISEKYLQIENLKLLSKLSEIYSKNLIFNFDSVEQFYNFPYDSKSKIKLDSAIISTNEFKYFSQDFPNLSTKIIFRGNIETNPDSIFLQKFDIILSKNSNLNSNIVIKNFDTNPEIFCYNLVTKIDIEDYNNLKLNKLFAYNFKLQKELQSLRKFSFAGNLDFEKSRQYLTGVFRTKNGNILSEITIINNKKNDEIDAKFSSEKFFLNDISGNSDLKFVKFSLNSKVQSEKSGTVNYSLGLQITNLLYNNYLYKNIFIKSNGNKNIYDIDIKSNDENFKAQFVGNFNDNKENSITKISATITYADLYKLNLDTSSQNNTFKGFAIAEIKGNDIDNFTGFIGANDIVYKINNDSIELLNLLVTADEYEKQRIIFAESDYFEIDIRGIYKFNSLKKASQNFISKYLPSYNIKNFDELDESDKNQIINFTADFKNLAKINKYFFKDIQIGDSTHLEAFFKTKNSQLDLKMNFPYITINNNIIKNLQIQTFTDKENLNINIDCNFNIDKNSKEYDHTLLYSGIISNNNLSSIFSWHNTGKIVYGGDISLQTNFNFTENDETISTTFSPTRLTFADEIWNIDGNSAVYKNDKLKFNNIQIYDSLKKIIINGYLSYDKNDALTAEIYDFDISNISKSFIPQGFSAEGYFNGNIIARDILLNPNFEIICRIEDFKLNNVKFGDFSLTASQDTISKLFNISAFAMNSENRFSLEGNISDQNDIDFYTTINKLDLKIVKPFLPEDFEIKEGSLYGNAQIFGNLNDINWNGTLGLKDTRINYKFLNTDFIFSTVIALSRNSLQIPKTEIFDIENNMAILQLEAIHNNFENINFKINIESKNFIFLNSEKVNDEGIYGKLYTSGDAVIEGNEKKIDITASLETNPGSEIFVATTEEEQIENNNFVFFGQKQIKTIQESENSDFSNINLDFNLNLTPQTNLTILLDETTGDALSLKGEGLLNFSVNSSGQTYVSGEYVFDKGKYNFYVENVYGKEFNVEKNSKISWNGSPFDANIEIKAVYNINKAKVFDFTLDETSRNEYVPVNCKIVLTEKLMSPTIKFEVDILEKGNSAASMMENLPEDEINKQFLSLLILNSFQPLPGLTKQDNLEGNYNINPTEILAGQLGSLVSFLSDDFDIDVKYNQKSLTNNEEIEVDFSTGILDDRILINGNVAKGEYRNTTNNIVGDFEAEIKMNKKGNLKMKVFNKSNRNITEETGPYTQGLSFFYKTEFNNLLKKREKNKTKE